MPAEVKDLDDVRKRLDARTRRRNVTIELSGSSVTDLHRHILKNVRFMSSAEILEIAKENNIPQTEVSHAVADLRAALKML